MTCQMLTVGVQIYLKFENSADLAEILAAVIYSWMDEIYQAQFDGKRCRAGTLLMLVFVEHLSSFILISIMWLFLK